MSIQRSDDSFDHYGASIDTKAGNITLSKASNKNWNAVLKYERAGADCMTLDGRIDDRPIHLQLQLMDRSKLTLISRGFHWIQEYPFNR